MNFTCEVLLRVDLLDGPVDPDSISYIPAMCLYCFKNPHQPSEGLEIVQISAYGASLMRLISPDQLAALLPHIQELHDVKTREARASWRPPSHG